MKGGKTLNDRILAANVRTESLTVISRYLKLPDDDQYKRALILKLAGTVLPRINEHTGEDGEAINVNIVKYGDPLAAQLHSEGLSDTSTESTG